MSWVNMTVFITHCWKSVRHELNGRGRTSFGLSALLFWAVLTLGFVNSANAQAPNSTPVEITELRLERSEGALLLQSSLKLELSNGIEDALQKGMPIYFVTEAELTRDRWYWYDRKVGAATRYYRLAYQPLTRRWRLNVSSEPISHAGVSSSLSQNFDSLQEALSVIRRQTGWKVADMADIDLESRQYVAYRFKLDVSQLPRPFQIAAGNQADWRLEIVRNLRVTADMVR